MQGNWAKDILEQYGGELERLNVHSHQGCNFYCSGCNHHSELIDPSESIDIDQTIKDLDHFLSIVNVRYINVLGGEPLLNPEGTRKICQFLLDKNQRVKMTTNGTYLSKNEDWLFSLIKQGMILKISVHLSKNDKGHSKLHNGIIEFSKKAIEQNLKFSKRNSFPGKNNEGWIEISDEFMVKKKYWMQPFIQKDSKIYPYDSNMKQAFKICMSNCPQIYKGKLYKCPHTAYLKDALSITDQLNDSFWKKYRYDGYDIYDNQQISKFLKTVYEPEDICSSCPETFTPITKNQDYDIKKKKIPIYSI